MHVTVGKNLEIVMQEIAVCEFSAVPVVDPHWQLQYFAAQMRFNQRQKASRTLTVPVRHLVQRSACIVNVYGFNILRVIVKPFLYLIIPDGSHALDANSFGSR